MFLIDLLRNQVCQMDDVDAIDVLLSASYRKNDREVFARMFDVNKKDNRELGPVVRRVWCCWF